MTNIDEQGTVWASTYEYVEDWASVDEAWDDLLKRHADDGWQLKFIIVDEDGGKKKGGRRLIFERASGLREIAQLEFDGDEEDDEENVE